MFIRKFIYFSGIILFLCTIQASAAGKAQISFQFKNLRANKIRLLLPVDDKPEIICHDMEIREDSVYTIHVPVKKNTYVRIGNIGVYVLPDDHITIVSDQADEKNPVLFSGENAEGLTQYNRLNFSMQNLLRQTQVKSLTKAPLDSVPEKMWANFRQIAENQIADFRKLKKEKKINKAFFELASRDINYYYAALFSATSYGIHYTCAEKGMPLPKGLGELWEKVYHTYPLTEAGSLTPWFPEYVNKYAKGLLAYKGKSMPDEYDLYASIVAGRELREYILAKRLDWLGINNKRFSQDYITLTEKYNREFPNSPYAFLLEPHIKKVTDFHQKANQDFSDQVYLVENYAGINSLRELLDRFKGKDLFIDFWYSSCSPCKEQFQYGEKLKEFLNKENIQILYISVDKEELEEVWRGCIKLYNLYGYHVRANRNLSQNLSKEYSINFFPSYMVVNKEGEIVLPRSLRPGDGEKLYSQIKKALNK